jgi:L-seryl-tRNA(Ser) seleniumtransferase
MGITEQQQQRLRRLPSVDHLLEMAAASAGFSQIPRRVLVRSIREVIASLREYILKTTSGIEDEIFSDEALLREIRQKSDTLLAYNLKRTVNATGVIVHTNLGRSLLAPSAIENIQIISGRYSNLEYDLEQGVRGSRYAAIEDILCELTGAEAALVVNNNAAAVLLCLETLAKGKEVVVSRGELVEIGGSFRVPDVMTKSGGILKEVGTTNRTHPKDYAGAVNDQTALFLKVHRSNYSIVGFTKEVSLRELVELGRAHQVKVMEDLGSGTLIDFSLYGLSSEPTVQDSVKAGVDVITFSGDKLLGGPQAGVIVGRAEILAEIKTNPLTRALRIDKMTLAGLEGTLHLYRDPVKATKSIPTLRMITQPLDEIKSNAQQLAARLGKIGGAGMQIELVKRVSRAGGGALPMLDLPTQCVAIKLDHMTVNALESFLRHYSPPIIGRIEDDFYLIDPRTLQEGEFEIVVGAFEHLFEEKRA